MRYSALWHNGRFMELTTEPETFTLENFEGPLNFLLHLIQKSELSITEIPLLELLKQFQKKVEEEALELNQGAEFIGILSSLICLKSRTLLPRHEVTEEEEDLSDPAFEVIHLLLEYCKIKEAAKDLLDRQSKQASSFSRGKEPLPEFEKGLGIDHLHLEALYQLFDEALKKAPDRKKGSIKEEEWRVSDKIQAVRSFFKRESLIPLARLFRMDATKEELIVTFLAILELMKNGEAALLQNEQGNLQLVKKDENDQTNN